MDREMTELARKRTKKSTCAQEKGGKKHRQRAHQSYNLIGAARAHKPRMATRESRNRQSIL